LSTSKLVLDSFPILVLLKKEDGWERVRSLLKEAREGSTELYMCTVNLVEVQYKIVRRNVDVNSLNAAVEQLPITLYSADELVGAVAMLKAMYPVSLADCFAAALALELECPVLTGDPEFHKLEELITVDWLS
jgi:uncharacterized protein